jgi:hypothetical protein
VKIYCNPVLIKQFLFQLFVRRRERSPSENGNRRVHDISEFNKIKVFLMIEIYFNCCLKAYEALKGFNFRNKRASTANYVEGVQEGWQGLPCEGQ